MPRVVKAHDERKKEIMDIAGALFLERGFRNTSVGDIVGRTGVAQGTFYYYFESKEAVLEAILTGLIDDLYGRVRGFCGQKPQPSGGRLAMILRSFVEFTRDDGSRFFRVPREEELLGVLERVRKYWIGRILPLLDEVIDQGVSEGIMRVENRRETVFFFWRVFHAYVEGVSRGEDPGILEVKRGLFEKLANVLLGMDGWSLGPGRETAETRKLTEE